MSPDQARQKDEARREAEKHLYHSAVDRLREENMVKKTNMDREMFSGDEMRTKQHRDANNAYAGEE